MVNVQAVQIGHKVANSFISLLEAVLSKLNDMLGLFFRSLTKL